MALYGPIGLLALVVVWLVLVIVGYGLMFHVVVDDWARAFELSGSSIFTLGFVVPPDSPVGTSWSSPRRPSGWVCWPC